MIAEFENTFSSSQRTKCSKEKQKKVESRQLHMNTDEKRIFYKNRASALIKTKILKHVVTCKATNNGKGYDQSAHFVRFSNVYVYSAGKLEKRTNCVRESYPLPTTKCWAKHERIVLTVYMYIFDCALERTMTKLVVEEQ